jgi:hypothetical protein
MKPYNINPEKIKIADIEIEAIVLGEKGRGRWQEIVPCPAPVPAEIKIEITKSGKPRISPDIDPSPGWIARVSTKGTYTRGTIGKARVPTEYRDRVKVIARGNGAEGDAGRIGSWDDLLVTVVPPFPVFMRVKRHGGYKTPAYWLIFTGEKVMKVPESELEITVDTVGIDMPALPRQPDDDDPGKMVIDAKMIDEI